MLLSRSRTSFLDCYPRAPPHPDPAPGLGLLATGVSIAATARACHLHRTTIHHWQRHNPHFATTLRDATLEQADRWNAESHQRAEASLAAVDTLLADPKTPATVKLKLALSILNSATAPPIHHFSSLDELTKDECRPRQKAADKSLDIPVAPRPFPAPPQISSHFITSTPAVESVETIRRNEPKIGPNQARPRGSGSTSSA